MLTLGPIQFAYSPGEVFPFTEVGGPIDEEQMPFPTNCYEEMSENFYCGTPFPMTPYIAAEMTGRYRFLVGLGEDMIGYMFPPGNFVGTEGEVTKEPWASYEDVKRDGNDRFGYGHSDDAESVGPYAGLEVTDALQGLLASDGPGLNVVPGLFVDAAGHLSDTSVRERRVHRRRRHRGARIRALHAAQDPDRKAGQGLGHVRRTPGCGHARHVASLLGEHARRHDQAPQAAVDQRLRRRESARAGLSPGALPRVTAQLHPSRRSDGRGRGRGSVSRYTR